MSVTITNDGARDVQALATDAPEDGATRLQAILPLRRPTPLPSVLAQRDAERQRAATSVQNHTALDRMRSLAPDFRRAVANRVSRVAAIRDDRSLSDEGKRARIDQTDRDMIARLEEIATRYATDEDRFLRAFGSRGEAWAASRELSAAEAARVNAMLTMLPHATPLHTLSLLQDAVETRDRAALTFVLPAVEGLAVTDERYRDIAADVAHWTALAREVSGDEARDAFDIARELAAAMRAQLAGALSIAARERQWDPVYDSTGNLSLFDTGISRAG